MCTVLVKVFLFKRDMKITREIECHIQDIGTYPVQQNAI